MPTSYDVSKALVAAGAKGTFFFNGNNCGLFLCIVTLFRSSHSLASDECIYDDAEIARVKYVVANGHQVRSPFYDSSQFDALLFPNLPPLVAYPRSLPTPGRIRYGAAQIFTSQASFILTLLTLGSDHAFVRQE